MIKIIENGIKIIIIVFLLWFLKSAYNDLNKFFTLTSNNEKSLGNLTKITTSLQKEVNHSKQFYEENKVIIENTKISDEEIQRAVKEIFKDITNKKIGFFELKDFMAQRDSKLINCYEINLSIVLKIDSIFSLEDVKLMIDKEMIKRITEFNKNNADLFKMNLVENVVVGRDYKIKIILLKNYKKNGVQ